MNLEAALKKIDEFFPNPLLLDGPEYRCQKAMREILKALASDVPKEPEAKPERSFERIARKGPGQEFWYINSVEGTPQCDVEYEVGYNCQDHFTLANNFNYYWSHNVAQSEAEYLRAVRKLRYIARELNGDWKPNFYCDRNGNAGQYYLACVNSGVGTSWTADIHNGGVFFETSSKAEIAQKAMTQRELDVLFGRV